MKMLYFLSIVHVCLNDLIIELYEEEIHPEASIFKHIQNMKKGVLFFLSLKN
jgi:hypothetical protein